MVTLLTLYILQEVRWLHNSLNQGKFETNEISLSLQIPLQKKYADHITGINLGPTSVQFSLMC